MECSGNSKLIMVSVTVIMIGNGISDQSSNPELDVLHFTLR